MGLQVRVSVKLNFSQQHQVEKQAKAIKVIAFASLVIYHFVQSSS